MTQQSLFPRLVKQRKSLADGQREHLARVESNLALAIRQFFAAVGEGNEFHAEDLLEHIASQGITCAPDSPGRIMRVLRRERKVNYTLVSRRASLYRVEGVGVRGA